MKPTADAETFIRGLIAQLADRRPDAFGLDEDLSRGLGLDSLSLLQIVAAVEEAYGVRIPDDEIDDLRTVRALLAQVVRER